MTNEQSIQNFKYGDMQFDLNKYSKDLNKKEVDSKFDSVFEMLDNNKDGVIVKDELQQNMSWMANEKGLLILGNGKDNIVLQFLNKYFPELVSKITDKQEIEQNEKELANEFENIRYIDIACSIANEILPSCGTIKITTEKAETRFAYESSGEFTLVYDKDGKYIGKYYSKEIYIADNSVNDSGVIVDKYNPEEIKCYYKREKQEGKPDIETRYYENKGISTVTQGKESIEYDLERDDDGNFVLGKIRSKYTTEYDNEGNITKQTIKNIADGTTTVLDGNTCGAKYDSEGNVLYTILTAKDKGTDDKVQIHLYPDGHIEGATELENLSGFRCQYNGDEYKVKVNNNKIISITKNGKSIYSPLLNEVSQKLDNASADEFINYIDQYKDDITKTLDIYKEQKGESLFETVISDFTMSKEDRIKILKHIINLVLNNAKEQGIATEDLLQKFEKEISYQMNKFGFANADYLEVFTNQTKHRINAQKMDKTISTPNGKIDKQFSQGQTGDCWLLASIKAIANSPKGLKILNDSLKVLPNGDVQVTLKGVNKIYIVTKQELENNIQMANGDGDVRALEIAVNKYFEEERGVRDGLDINGNYEFVAFYLLTGKGNFDHFLPFGSNGDRIINPDYSDHEFTDEEINSFNTKNKIITVRAHGNQKDIQVNSTENDVSSTLTTDHSYAVLRSDKDYIYLINPWNSEDELKVPRKTFKEFFNNVNEMQL